MKIYKRIVCAVDFSHNSEVACRRAIELARNFEARLIMLYVVEYFPEDRSNELIAPETTDPASYREREARKGLANLATRLQFEDAHHEVLFSPHAAWHEIVRFARDGAMELIVLGSHGNHGIAALLGSTANGVANRAPCDVLAVRAQEELE